MRKRKRIRIAAAIQVTMIRMEVMQSYSDWTLEEVSSVVRILIFYVSPVGMKETLAMEISTVTWT